MKHWATENTPFLYTVSTCDIMIPDTRDRLYLLCRYEWRWHPTLPNPELNVNTLVFDLICLSPTFQINEEIPVKHLPSSEPDPHVVRIGWSLNHCSTQLGERSNSQIGRDDVSHEWNFAAKESCCLKLKQCISFCQVRSPFPLVTEERERNPPTVSLQTSARSLAKTTSSAVTL